MNEKLKELAIEAKIQMVSEPRLDNFAELIIAECIKSIEEEGRSSTYTTFDKAMADTIIAKSILSIQNKFK
jgi:hypothetical protein